MFSCPIVGFNDPANSVDYPTILINVNRVVSIKESTDSRSHLALSDGSQITVAHSVTEVAKMVQGPFKGNDHALELFANAISGGLRSIAEVISSKRL